ncbi:MAG: right-handed parallel beta-helix repeat-containing protein [Chloroflexi bacterium]|nr:right-handed parallel beta-helix repeat-containing protein [Chloroflexota bacterium]
MNHPLLRSLFLLTAILLLRPLVAQAETFDIPAGDVAALIAAVNAANANGPGADVINLETGTYTLMEVNNTYVKATSEQTYGGGPTGLPVVFGTLTINGNGATIQRADDAPDFRILLLDGSLTLNNITIRNGRATASDYDYICGGCAGGIMNFGTLILNDSTVADNYATGGAAGIYEYTEFGRMILNRTAVVNNLTPGSGGGIFVGMGDISIIDSTLAANIAGNEFSDFGGAGGGLVVQGDGNVEIRNSTISDNQAIGGPTHPFAGLGGGMYIITSKVMYVSDNTTISGNRAGAGAAIYNTGSPINFTNVTIADNVALRDGGGILVFGGNNSVTFRNSLLANNQPANCTDKTDPALHLKTFISEGNNIDTDGSCKLDTFGDQSGVNAGIGILADNGGLTRTHALQANSPAVNNANPAACPPRDQRGTPREGICDIGAFELSVSNMPDMAVPVRNIYTTSQPELSWSPVTWAVAYDIEVANNLSFSIPRFRNTSIPANTLSISTSKLWNGLWYWRVRARRPDGAWGGWSATDMFYVNVTPPAP